MPNRLYWASVFEIDTTNSWGDNNETVSTTRLGEDIHLVKFGSKGGHGYTSRKVTAPHKSKGNIISPRDDMTLGDPAALTALENPAEVILTNGAVTQGEPASFTRSPDSAAQTDNAVPTRPALHPTPSRKIKETVRTSRALKHSTVRTKSKPSPQKTDSPVVKCNSGNPACAKDIASSANAQASFQDPDSWTIAAGALCRLTETQPLMDILTGNLQFKCKLSNSLFRQGQVCLHQVQLLGIRQTITIAALHPSSSGITSVLHGSILKPKDFGTLARAARIGRAT
jgi:hypothetical protein